MNDKQGIKASPEEPHPQAGVNVTSLSNGVEAIDPWGTRVRLLKV